jgi:hypothetical protein
VLFSIICLLGIPEKANAQNWGEQLDGLFAVNFGNGDSFDPNLLNSEIQDNYLFRWPVPKVEGQCTLQVRFHLSKSSDFGDLDMEAIETFLDEIFNPKEIYFTYDYVYNSQLDLPTSPPFSKLDAIVNGLNTNFSTSFIDFVLVSGEVAVNSSSFEFSGSPVGEKIYSFVPTMPSNFLGATYLYPDANSSYDEHIVNRRIIAYSLGYALGLLPTVGFTAISSSGGRLITATYTSEFYFDSQTGFDFVSETSPVSVQGFTPADIDWDECYAFGTTNTMPPSLTNIMVDADFHRTCPNEITIEQGRKVRYNVVNDNVLFNCLTSGSTMTLNGYTNIPVVDYEITANTVWTHPVVFTNLIIDQGKKLESNSLIEFAPDVILKDVSLGANQELLVSMNNSLSRPLKASVLLGGELKINGGTVTKYEPYGFPWLMIELIGNRNLSQSEANQPKAIFIDAEVSHAQEVVFPAQTATGAGNFVWSSTGGYVQATNTIFTNNRRVTGFLSYENVDNGVTSNNVSFFEDCKFITNQDYLFPSSPTQLSFWQVDKIKVAGCEFTNTIPKIDDQYAGYGIYSIQASFDVEKNQVGEFSTFAGFDYAIKAELLQRPFQTIRVMDALFEDNLHGAFFKNVDFHVFVGNSLLVPSLPDNYPVFNVGGHNGAYGYYNLAGTGFACENNTFEQIDPNAMPFQQPFGVVVSHSGPDKNAVRRNNFLNFNTGILAVGNNRNYSNAGISNQSGLQLLCNNFSDGEFDIHVPPVVSNAFMPTITSDVAHYQGGDIDKGGNPAGNLFSHASQTIMDFANDGPNMVVYFHHDPSSNSRVLPRLGYTSGLINSNQFISHSSSTCPTRFKTNYNYVWGDILDAAQDYEDLVNLYLSILDQGSTPNLLAQIYATPSSEYFDLYVDLMNEPGNLSEEVVMELVENPEFPNILLRNIVIANPHLLQEDHFWQALENRTPAFTQTMLDEMWNGLANISDMQLLYAQMGNALMVLNSETSHALRSIGEKPQDWGTNSDTITMICNLLPNPYYKILGHLHHKRMDPQYLLEDSIQSLFSNDHIADEDFAFFEELTEAYLAYYNALTDVEAYQNTISGEKSALEDLMLNSFHLGIRGLASAILMQEAHEQVPPVDTNLLASAHFDVVVYPGASSSKKARRPMPVAQKPEVAMAAYPNPTAGATHLDYSFSKNPEEIFVTMHNLEGKLVFQKSLKTNMPIGSMPIDVSHLSPGIYMVTLSAQSGEMAKVKLIKN